MFKTTLSISGMACSMCESHVNDAIRNAFSVEKVTSSHTKGETVIISKEEPNRELLAEIIAATGYTLNNIKTEPYVKKGLFGFGK